MAALNGQLPDSMLAAIPSGRLRTDAAAAWNAMHATALERHGVDLRPLGGMSSYRTLAQQVYLWNGGGGTVAHPHDTNWVARPGTSNHGWGLAVDLGSQRMRWVVDQIGREYGWSKACSDAPGEWWHIKFNPSCTRATWKPDPAALHHGQTGPSIRRLQLQLRALGFNSVAATGFYGDATSSAVRRFQVAHHLSPATGDAGPRTLAAIARLVRR